MSKQIEIEMALMRDFTKEANALREKFPKFAREIDKCMFDAGQNHLRSCGHAECDCQISFADFHAERNRIFGTTNEALVL